MVNTTPKALIPRFPGSKRRHLKRWAPYLTEDYDTVVEVFGGALWLSQAIVQSGDRPVSVIASEIAPDLRSLYYAWAYPELRGKVEHEFRGLQSLGAERAWETSKNLYTSCTGSLFYPKLAAAGLTLRLLSFSGIIRDSPKTGALNISPTKCQFERWEKHKIDWPKPCDRLRVYLSHNEIIPPNHGELLVICDPPYVGDLENVSKRNGNFMSPCYFGHRPHAKFTADLAKDPVEMFLKRKVGTLIACNYFHPWLHEFYLDMAQCHGYSLFVEKFGRLDRLNNNARKAKLSSSYVDTSWIFKRK